MLEKSGCGKLHYPVAMIEAYAEELVVEKYSLAKLVRVAKERDGVKLKKLHIWNDMHAYLPYINFDLMLDVDAIFSEHRKNNEPFCRTHKIFEKVKHVSGWLKVHGKSFFGKIIGFFASILNKIISFVGNLIEVIGKFISEKIFKEVIHVFNNWHDDHHGLNYKHSSDSPQELGIVDEWSGIPVKYVNRLNNFYHKLMKKHGRPTSEDLFILII